MAHTEPQSHSADTASHTANSTAAGIKAVVFDIEGTVCSISFVKDVLYPFAIEKAEKLVPHVKFPPIEGADELQDYLVQFPDEYKSSPQALLDHVKDLTARDIKATYWKNLQGYLWKSGYDSGEIKVDLFEDAASVLPSWSQLLRGRQGGVYIYSSGSVPAQKLLFGHTVTGDLNPLLDGYFDTVNAGPKTEASSYTKIAHAINQAPQHILFFSDNPKEIDAATAAGWHTVFTIRPGNAPADGYQAPEKTVTEFSNSLIA